MIHYKRKNSTTSLQQTKHTPTAKTHETKRNQNHQNIQKDHQRIVKIQDTMKGRENNNKDIVKLKRPSSDLLVCFPTRAHLTLMPKPIFSPSKPKNEPIKRHNKHIKRINTRVAISSGRGPDSPHIWAKDNQIRGGGPEMSEPTSPKVTCAGQIKVRPRSLSNSVSSCRNWQSVMEELEKIHINSKNKKSSSLVQPFGFKKDVMNFLTCLRNAKFDFWCFGSFPEQDLSSNDDDEDDDYEEDDSFEKIIDDNNNNNEHDEKDRNGNNDNNVFSKWYMVLQENQSHDAANKLAEQDARNDNSAPAVSPPSALISMRCRSAPAKSWLKEEKEQKEKGESKEEEKVEEKDEKNGETLAIAVKYDADFYKLSNDIAQETWVVGEIKGPLSRSRSCRR